MIWGEADVITLRNKVHNRCDALESSLNRPTTPPGLWKSCLSMKLILSVRKVRDCALKLCSQHWISLLTTYIWKVRVEGSSESWKAEQERWEDFHPVAELCPAMLSLLHVYSEVAHQTYILLDWVLVLPHEWKLQIENRESDRNPRGIPASIFASSFIYNF